MTPLVSVVIVSYQTRDLTVECLTALKQATVSTPCEFIVVENASTDGSAEAITAAVPEVRLVRLVHNVGFGRAVNAGAELARGRWLLMVNPDTTPVGDVVAAFIRAAEKDPGSRIWTGRTLRPDGTDDGRSCFGLPTLWSTFCFAVGLSTLFRFSRWLNPEALPHLDRSRRTRVIAASACLLLIELVLFTQMGGFTPEFFMYSEDIDLCVRAAAHGATPMLVPTAQVNHLGGAASTSVNKRVMVLRGKCTFVRRHWSRRRARAGLALLAAGVGVRALGSVLTGRARYWRQVWTQRASWLAGWPPVEQLPPVEVIEASEPHAPFV